MMLPKVTTCRAAPRDAGGRRNTNLKRRRIPTDFRPPGCHGRAMRRPIPGEDGPLRRRRRLSPAVPSRTWKANCRRCGRGGRSCCDHGLVAVRLPAGSSTPEGAGGIRGRPLATCRRRPVKKPRVWRPVRRQSSALRPWSNLRRGPTYLRYPCMLPLVMKPTAAGRGRLVEQGYALDVTVRRREYFASRSF